MLAMSVHAVQTGHGTLVPEKYNTQVIPWTQSKHFSENLGGGGLEVMPRWIGLRRRPTR